MSRRKLKQKHLLIVQFQQKGGFLNQEQADLFATLFRKCVRPPDFQQVSQTLTNFVSGVQTRSDRHARIMQEDALGLNDGLAAIGL